MKYTHLPKSKSFPLLKNLGHGLVYFHGPLAALHYWPIQKREGERERERNHLAAEKFRQNHTHFLPSWYSQNEWQ